MADRVVRLETVIAAAWGNDEDSVPEVLIDHPPFGDVSPGQQRKIRAAIPINLDPRGAIRALIGSELLLFSAGGRIALRTPVSDPLDFGVDAAGSIYLLESRERLAKVDAAGQSQWRRTGLEADRLLVEAEGYLCLHSSTNPERVTVLDSSSGELLAVHSLRTPATQVFGTNEGTLLRVVYFAEQQRRGLSRFDLRTGRETARPGSREMYRWLFQPFGTDRALHCHVYDPPAIRRISFEGEQVASLPIECLVVRNDDGAIFTSWHGDGTQHITRHGSSPRQWHVPAPEGPLIHVGSNDHLYVLSGEEPGDPGTLLELTLAGQVVSSTAPPPDLLPLESRLHSYETWRSDGSGQVYLPVSDAVGFKVIRAAF